MITGDMRCAYCGVTGKIDGSAARSDDGGAAVFQYRGYNPVSGHVHYQCPSCSIVQLVLPMDILDGRVASGFSAASGRGDFFGTTAAKALQWANEFRKTLQTRLLPGNVGLVERRG